MKKLLLTAGAFAILASTSAFAADIVVPVQPPPPPPPPPPPVEQFEHTLYFGLQVGYGWGSKLWEFTDFGTFTSHPVGGILAGVQMGINDQRGNFFFGAEVDVNWSGMTGSSDCPNAAFTCTTDINWLSTMTGRIGFDVGPALIYAEGGAAVAGETFTADSGAITRTATGTNWGWTAGGGVEFEVGSGWGIDLEYSYVNFGTDSYVLSDGVTPDEPIDVTQSLHLFRVGINRLF